MRILRSSVGEGRRSNKSGLGKRAIF